MLESFDEAIRQPVMVVIDKGTSRQAARAAMVCVRGMSDSLGKGCVCELVWLGVCPVAFQPHLSAASATARRRVPVMGRARRAVIVVSRRRVMVSSFAHAVADPAAGQGEGEGAEHQEHRSVSLLSHRGSFRVGLVQADRCGLRALTRNSKFQSPRALAHFYHAPMSSKTTRSYSDYQAFRTELNEKILARGTTITKRFFTLDTKTYEAGAIDEKTKELLGLSASMVLRCDDCIAYHIDQCVKAGASDEELFETFDIALIVGGSIVIPHLRRAVAFLDECRAQRTEET